MSRRKEKKAAKAAAKAAKATVKAEFAAQKAQGKKKKTEDHTYIYQTDSKPVSTHKPTRTTNVDTTDYSYVYENKEEKKLSKKGKIFCIVCIIIIFFGLLSMCGEDEVSDNSSSEATKATEESYKYMTEAIWADLSHYAFAIENDSYDGDVFEAGTYNFYPTLVNAEPGELVQGSTQIVWDIYVSKNEYTNISQLSDSELKATVGGIDQLSATLELKEGQFVYIKYNDVIGEPLGALQIEMK